MRPIKTFGLAVMVIGAFMAGATSASAVAALEKVVLCKSPEPLCLNGFFGSNNIVHGTLASGTTAELLGGLGVLITCTSSTVLGEVQTALAHGEITALAFSSCTNDSDKKPCSLTAERLNYLFKGELSSTDKGYIVLVTAKPGKEQPESRLQCESLGIDCKYGAETLTFEAEESEDTVLKVSQFLSGLGFCFTNAVWHAKYLTRCLETLLNKETLEPELIEESCFLRME